MTSDVSPELAEKLAHTQARVQAKTHEISDGVAAKSKEIEEESQHMREAAEQRSRELDERVQQRLAEQADPHTQNQWPQRLAYEATYRLGVPEEDVALEQESVESVPARATSLPPVASSGRHARLEDAEGAEDAEDTADDEYFSNSGWLQ